MHCNYSGEHYDCNWAFVFPAGLLSSFVEVESIKRHFKSRLVGTVLNGYLCLRKLVVQRTKLIDETQDMLLEMLEDMTTGLRCSFWTGRCSFKVSFLLNCVLLTGTESETKAFMAVCIETAKRYNLDDYRTPVFIFERLCSIIYPVSDTRLEIPDSVVRNNIKTMQLLIRPQFCLQLRLS